MKTDTLKKYGRLAARLGAIAAVAGGVFVLGLLGWQWQASATVDHVVVSGARHAPVDTLRRLAQVDSGGTMDAVNPALVADRVARHPWVASADVTLRRATRTLAIDVTERTPAALVVDAEGRPSLYLDAAGYGLPVPRQTAAASDGPDVEGEPPNVPLVYGLRAPYHPMRVMAPPMLRDVLAALHDAETNRLIDAVTVHRDSSVTLLTAPVGGRDPATVRLGRGDVPGKLARLRAFARQVLAPTDAPPIREIDLRFDGQIVTRDQPLDG